MNLTLVVTWDGIIHQQRDNVVYVYIVEWDKQTMSFMSILLSIVYITFNCIWFVELCVYDLWLDHAKDFIEKCYPWGK